MSMEDMMGLAMGTAVTMKTIDLVGDTMKKRRKRR